MSPRATVLIATRLVCPFLFLYFFSVSPSTALAPRSLKIHCSSIWGRPRRPLASAKYSIFPRLCVPMYLPHLFLWGKHTTTEQEEWGHIHRKKPAGKTHNH